MVYYGSDHAGGWQSLDAPLRTVTTLDRFALVKPTDSGHVMRMLQPEELKIAMGWPRGFKIKHGTRRDKIKMIGNAVCPPVMREIVMFRTSVAWRDMNTGETAGDVFRPRARLMLLLGDELIRDTGIAVFELVKNAYDADASECTVTLRNVDKESSAAEIIVEDNGSGMAQHPA